jgi:putative Ca2+/H+ antiporter (TMEM165/GDT1 family)
MSQIMSAFFFIFLASLPGRTTFLLITLAVSGNPKKIFIGASLAFFIQCLISVLLGEALSFIPQSYFEIFAGLAFLYFSVHYWIESRKPLESKIQPHSIKSVFLAIFVAEFGDASQFAIATMAAQSASKIQVFLIAVAALWIISILAVLIGRSIKHQLKPSTFQKIAASFFLIIAGYFFVKGVSSLP